MIEAMRRSVSSVTPDDLRAKVRVKAPLSRLLGPGLDLFLERGYSPEVCLESWHLDRLDPTALAGLAGTLGRAGLVPTLHGPFVGLDPGAPDRLDRDLAERYFEAALRAARTLRPVTAVFHGGSLIAVTMDEKARWLDASLPLWTRLARALTDLGCTLAVENVVDGDPEFLLPLVQAVAGEGGGWCFDIGHRQVFGTAGLDRWLEVLGPHLVHLHLHDNFGGRDDHLPLGRGSIDLARVFQGLAGLDTVDEPTATLEVDYRHGVEESLEILADLWPWA